jgi:hypothetical protein
MIKGKNIGSNWSYQCFQLKEKIVKMLSNVMYCPSHRQTGALVINIQSALRNTPDLCNNISLAVLFGSNGHSYTVSTLSGMCVYTHILHNKEMPVVQKK